MQNSIWKFETAQGIQFGRGCTARLCAELQRHQLHRPFVVTDKTVGQLDTVQRLLNGLRDRTDLVVFDGCEAEPSVGIAEQAIAAAKVEGQSATGEHPVDCVIGIGGGSNLDVAKVVSIVMQHGGQPRDYFGFDAVPGPVIPIFAVPTTAGTGSEVSHSAVLTDVENEVKVSTLSRWLRPTSAFVDPELTDTCPVNVTAESGIDALVHAIEAYTNRDFKEMTDVDPQAQAYEGSYPFTRLLAAEAIRLIGRSLVPACRAASGDLSQEASKHARDEMAWGATLAGMAFSNSGVGIVHALEYPIGSLTHCGHGEGNGLLLPHVMRYNLKHRIEQFSDIARWLGADVIGKSQRQTAVAAVEAVVQLQADIGIRTKLSDLGLEREQIPKVATKAFEIRRLMEINSRPVAEQDLVDILEAAF